MPSRRDLDPVVEIPTLLPNLQLIEIVGNRFRFRLIGTELAYAFGRDYTGLFVDELFEGQRAKDICSVYSVVRDERHQFLCAAIISARAMPTCLQIGSTFRSPTMSATST